MSGTLAILRHRPVWFTLLLLVLVAAFRIWTEIGATEKLQNAGLADAAGPRNLVVTLAMEPEKFHMEVLQDAGRMVLVDGRRIELRDVPERAIRSLAHRYWITGFTPLDGDGGP